MSQDADGAAAGWQKAGSRIIDFRATKKAARGSLFLVIGRAGSNWTLIGPRPWHSQSHLGD